MSQDPHSPKTEADSKTGDQTANSEFSHILSFMRTSALSLSLSHTLTHTHTDTGKFYISIYERGTEDYSYSLLKNEKELV